jgi:uncharacterized membrane protein
MISPSGGLNPIGESISRKAYFYGAQSIAREAHILAAMGKGRLEAFSDGVIAIIITIMVLELKTPAGIELEDLRPLAPVLLGYLLSFVFVGIYWNNHHHLLHAATKVDAKILWANLHLLFWMSLIPFTTGWMGHHFGAPLPCAAYGVVLAMAGLAYRILQTAIVACHGKDSKLAKSLGSDLKGTLSVILYVVAIPLAFKSTIASAAIYVLVAAIWLVPDRRVARVVNE